MQLQNQYVLCPASSTVTSKCQNISHSHDTAVVHEQLETCQRLYHTPNNINARSFTHHSPRGRRLPGRNAAKPSTSTGSCTNAFSGCFMRASAFQESSHGPPPTSTAAADQRHEFRALSLFCLRPCLLSAFLHSSAHHTLQVYFFPIRHIYDSTYI